MSTPTNTFNEEQKMLAFAFMADVDSGQSFVTSDGEKYGEKRIFKALTDHNNFPEITKQLRGWSLIYGPATYFGSSTDTLVRNSTIILHNSADKHIVVAVAGTNFICKYDWFIEDLEVANLVPWNNSIVANGENNTGAPTGGHIAVGTAKALMRVWNTKDTSNNTSPIEFLKDNLSNLPCDRLTVVGHSLGGAIAPVLATAISDNYTKWNTTGSVIPIDTYPFAGPTPGDSSFRKYAESKVTVNSFYNTKDVVPHAWQMNMLDELNNIFYPWLTKIGDSTPTKLIYWVIKFIKDQALKAKANGYLYERWHNEQTFVGLLSATQRTSLVNTAKKYGPHMTDLLSTDACDALIDITGVTSNVPWYRPIKKREDLLNKLTPFLIYFLEYLNLLDIQHVDQYKNQIWNNPAFLTEWVSSELFGASSKWADLSGLGVLDELFNNISKFKG